jgi:hypothetical protein
MGDPVNVVRMTISVQKALKARMDTEDKVNWSAVASTAFEEKLLDIASRKKGAKTMDETIARLRAVAEVEENETYQAGYQAGQEWAKGTASPKQLRRLAKRIDDFEDDSETWWDIDHPGWRAPLGATGHFAAAVLGDKDSEQHEVDSFWEEALGDDVNRIQDSDFFHGFGHGAAAVWEQVKDKL